MPLITPAQPSFPVLTLSERDRRWAAVDAIMSVNSLDAVVVFGSSRDRWDRYLTNDSHAGVAFKRPGEPVQLLTGRFPLARFDEPGRTFQLWATEFRVGAVQSILAEEFSTTPVGRVGVVGMSSQSVGANAGYVAHRVWEGVLAKCPAVDFVDIAPEFEFLALVKSDEERALLRKAAEIGELACEAFLDAARPGAREAQVAGAVIGTIVANGGWAAEPGVLMRSGRSSFGWPQPEWAGLGGGSRVLTAGDLVSAEIFASYAGMESQQQMIVSLGAPDDQTVELHAAVQDSYAAGLDVLRPGVSFAELSDAMHAPLLEVGAWNTGPHIQTVAPVMFNSPTHIGVSVDAAMTNLPQLPPEVPRDGDFEVVPGVAFAFEPNAVKANRRVCIGGTVLVTEGGYEELNQVPNQLHVLSV